MTKSYAMRYGTLYQGYTHTSTADLQNPSFFFTLHEALPNTFALSNKALLILSGFTVALMKPSFDNKFFLHDSHERDSNVFSSLFELENHIRKLSTTLKVDQYEITSTDISKMPHSTISPDGDIVKKIVKIDEDFF